MDKTVGKIVQIIGPVLDVRFDSENLPNIYDAIEVHHNDIHVVAEVMQHVGDNTVRCVSMSSTDGLQRGVDAINTGKNISVPVGKGTLGRLFNVLGDPIDEKGPVDSTERWAIHREAPSFEDQETSTEDRKSTRLNSSHRL